MDRLQNSCLYILVGFFTLLGVGGVILMFVYAPSWLLWIVGGIIVCGLVGYIVVEETT